jgi:hypothetical protein
MSDKWQIDGWRTVPLTGRRFIPGIAVGILLIGAGGLILWVAGGNRAAAIPPSAAAAAQVSNELVEKTKDLEMIQQQAVDQLQVVQDLLTTQRAETKKLSDEVATLSRKFDALERSVSNNPASSVGSGAPLPKAAEKPQLNWRGASRPPAPADLVKRPADWVPAGQFQVAASSAKIPCDVRHPSVGGLRKPYRLSLLA